MEEKNKAEQAEVSKHKVNMPKFSKPTTPRR